MSNRDKEQDVDWFRDVLLNKVDRASNLRSPLDLDREDVIALKGALKEAGIDLENVSERAKDFLIHGSQLRAKVVYDFENDTEVVKIFDWRLKKTDGGTEIGWTLMNELAEADFKDELMFVDPEDGTKDKSLALIEMLGPERFEEVIKLSYKEAIKRGYKEKIGHLPGTEGRGLQQNMADILALAVLDTESESFQEDLDKIQGRINTRIWAGYRESSDISSFQDVDENFKAAGVKRPGGLVNGLPPMSVTNAFNYLAGKRNEYGKPLLLN